MTQAAIQVNCTLYALMQQLFTQTCLFSSPVPLLLEVTALPFGQPPLGIRLGTRILRIKVFGKLGFPFPLLLFPYFPTGQISL